MLIYSKDRDQTFNFAGENHNFHTDAKWYQGVCAGINLYCDDFMLGTFDTVQEIIDEIDAIYNCPGDIYYVSGYSDYDGTDDWNALCELMAEGETEQ